VIARGSVFECVAILELMKDDGILTNEVHAQFYELAEELSKMLYSMIKLLEGGS